MNPIWSPSFVSISTNDDQRSFPARRSSIILLFYNFFWPVLGGAEEKPWPLSQILIQAEKNSPSLKAGAEDVNSASALALQAGKWDNPTLGLSAGSYSIAPNNGSALNLMVMQNIPLFGQKSVAQKIGNKQSELASLDLISQRLLIRHEVVRLSYRLGALDEQLRHFSHRRENLGQLKKYLKSRNFVSPSQRLEKNLIEHRMRELEQKFSQVVANRDAAWQDLNVHLGLSETIHPKISWKNPPLLPGPDAPTALNPDQSPLLKRQHHKLSVTQLEKIQAGKMAYPDIRIGAGYYRQIVANDGENSIVGAIELSLPIWNRGQDAVRAADSRLLAEQHRMDFTRRQVKSNLAKAWSHVKEAKKRVALFPESLAQTLESQLEEAEANWKKGLVTASAFLDLESQVHDQATFVYEAQIDLVEAISEVLIGSGSDILIPLEKN